MIRVYIHRLLFFLAFNSSFFLTYTVDHVLSLWIKPYPSYMQQPSSFLVNSFMPNAQLASLIEYSLVWPTAGIVALYGGYSTVTDFSGQITFPLMQQQPIFTLLITQHIRPVFMLGNTIHHWEIIPHQPVRCFSIKRIYDAATNLYIWNTEEAPLPPHSIIPLNAIILFINPEAIMVPIGATLTSDQPQFVLPSLYLINHPDLVHPALNALRIKNFFGFLTDKIKKQRENYYARQITTHPNGK